MCARALLVRHVSLFVLLAVLGTVPVAGQTPAIRTHFDGEWAGTLVKIESQGEWGSLQFYRDSDRDFVQVGASGADLRRWASAVEAMQAETYRVGRNERVELQAQLYERARDTGNVIVTRTVTSRGSVYTIEAMDEYLVNFIVINATPARIRSLLRYVRVAARPEPTRPQAVGPTGARTAEPDASGGETGTAHDTDRANPDENIVERPERGPRVSSVRFAVYPDEARRAGVKARARVRVLVDSAGRVVSAELLERILVDRRGREQAVAALPYGLEEAATAAARTTDFHPAQEAGEPVRSYATLTITVGMTQ